jgi:prepilin-type N-terminal cleavage/methylation domain-containing protein
MKINLREKYKGFTLIELLVVIAIIGLLVGMVVISVRGVKAKARDAERVSEMNSLTTVLGLYHSDYNLYPIFDGYITGNDAFSLALEATTYINNVPTDPSDMDSNDCGGVLNLTGYHYYYRSTDGRSYILGYCLETNSMQGRAQGENYLSP